MRNRTKLTVDKPTFATAVVQYGGRDKLRWLGRNHPYWMMGEETGSAEIDGHRSGGKNTYVP